MSRVDFYHLQKQTLEEVLPKLLGKALELHKNILVRIGNEERVEFLNSHLWTFDNTSFLPHGSKKDGFSSQQPVWLTAGDDNPNNAELLFLVDGAYASPQEINQFERVFNIFDGNDQNSLEQARKFWKELKNASLDIFYWKQDDNGRWTQAA